MDGDDFFSSFDDKTAKPSSKAPPPPPPRASSAVQQQQQRRRPPPQQQQQRPTPTPTQAPTTSTSTTSRSAVRPPSKPVIKPATSATAKPLTGSTYYSGSTASTYRRPSADATPLPASAAASTYYGQQQQQPVSAPTPPPAVNDWYASSPQPQAWNPAAAAAAPSMEHTQMQQPLLRQPQPSSYAQPPAKSFAQQPWMPQSTLDSALSGSMDDAAAPQPTIFAPTMSGTPSKSKAYDSEDWENEPPLLEELGINIDHIMMKTKAVVIPFKRFNRHSALLEPNMIVEDADLAGPLAFALLLGAELLFSGKIQFGYIYGFSFFGCLAMTLVLNLMAPDQAVSVWTVASILGYSLLPVNVLAAVKIVLVNIAKLTVLGRLLGLVTVLWSTTASTRLLEVGCDMADQRYLLAYPIALLYSAFVLITIF